MADPPSNPDTEALAREARHGSAPLGPLYARLAPALYAWASLRIPPTIRDRLDPEDVVQEVWWRAIDTFDTYDEQKGAFRPWVFGIATHVLLNAIRRVRRRSYARADLPTSWTPDAVADDGTRISQRVARDEDVARLLALVQDLPTPDRQIFTHRGLEGLTAAQTAHLLNLTEAAVAKRWQRLRAHLQDRLKLDDLLD